MAEYSITLPDGTCVEGEHHINVVHMAQILRETDDEDDDDGVTVEYSGSGTYDGESKTLQERVYKAFASNDEFPHWSIKQPPGSEYSSEFYLETYDPNSDECGCVVCELRDAKEEVRDRL